MTTITSNDILIYLQIVITLVAFFGLLLKITTDSTKTRNELSSKLNEIDTKFTRHIATAETNIEHIMNKLGMAVRGHVRECERKIDS